MIICSSIRQVGMPRIFSDHMVTYMQCSDYPISTQLVTRVLENPEHDRDTTKLICRALAKADQNPRLFDIFDKEFIDRHGRLSVVDWYTKISLSAWGIAGFKFVIR
jgi:hypothetical protein